MEPGRDDRRARPQRLQRLLNFYAWDTGGLRDDVRTLAVRALGAADHGVLILDGTGFLKEGTKSAGVARQYSGTAGRIEDCQKTARSVCSWPTPAPWGGG